MYKVFVSLMFVVSVMTVNAQLNPDTTKVNTHLYERFIEGTVLMKSGAKVTAPLNYDVYKQSIVF